MPIRSAWVASLPEGEDENSPGWSPPWRTEPWEGVANVPVPSRRDGRNLPPNITGIIFNVVLLGEGDVLGLEVSLSMMLLLARYMCERGAHLGPSDGEGTIAFLPLEIFYRAGLVHTVRRCALDFPHSRGDQYGRRQRKQKMDVVLGSSDAARGHLMLARDSAHVGPKTLLDLRDDGFAPLLCGENTMIERAEIGV